MHPDKQDNKSSENVANGSNLVRETQSLSQRENTDCRYSIFKLK
jgi:hypothetical protein